MSLTAKARAKTPQEIIGDLIPRPTAPTLGTKWDHADRILAALSAAGYVVVSDHPDWRSLFVLAVEAFEAERPDIWLDDEFGVPLPELDDAKAAYR